MSPTYVVIDVETTGLDPEKDAIVEVAAIVLRENDILEEFSSLVNPYRPIPVDITRLTGITQAMVDDAPGMFAIKSQLRRFVGERIVVGHNVDFDLDFLTREFVGVGNHRLDTLTLASILLPGAGRFGLDALVNYLNLPAPEGGQAHRAYADALQTAELFLALMEKAQQIDRSLLEEIIEAGRQIGWPEALFFETALAAQARTAFTSDQPASRGRLKQLFNPVKLEGRIPVPVEEPEKLDGSLLTGLLQPGGNFSRAFPGYEFRPQQVEMLQAVVDAFNNGRHLLVEAGTGTGKSIGYLLPAAFWAVQNGRLVVISTNTINLQDQLLQKDIPELQKLLPFELRAAVRKGRSNYLCTRLFRQLRHSGPTSADEMTLFARLLLWLPHTDTGDVAEVNLRSMGERLAWTRLNGENAVCRLDDCAQEGCPLHIARRRAELAHLLVVNHSLLLSDVANNNHILPPFQDLIVDEAHHLESAVTDGLSFRADRRLLDAFLEEITSSRTGLVADLQQRTRALPQEFTSLIDGYVNQLRDLADRAGERADDFFQTLDYFLADYVRERSQFAQQVRLVPGIRIQPGYEAVEMSWVNLSQLLKPLAKGLVELAEGLVDLTHSFDIEDGEDMRLTLVSHGRSLEEVRAGLDQILSVPVDGMIYWLEQYRDRISLHAAPLHVGPLVEEHIFHAKETVILTSATLQTASARANDRADFDYIRDRLHAHSADELAVGSPFDYENSTLVYLCTDIPEPNQPGYQRYLEEAIVDVATALHGRTMVLFTSYSQLNQTARSIAPQLDGAGLSLLAQGEGLSRQQLLEQFREVGATAVLLGTRSFWEGVDVPGEALQAVLIAKLPFDVPSDPVFAARSETFDNPFMQYSIPEAVLRFRQGFGRLIRRKSDKGVVAILDKRVLTKRYGNLFIEALPSCTLLRQRTGRLGELTLRWLNRENG